MLTMLPSFGHIIPLSAIAFLILFWGAREQKRSSSDNLNNTFILGIILVFATIVYSFYSQGPYFGVAYLIFSLFFAKFIKNNW
ncbi:MAG: hypothetical protein Q7S18_02615 [bacterium]|nr:hypothetical protein [bacterium]